MKGKQREGGNGVGRESEFLRRVKPKKGNWRRKSGWERVGKKGAIGSGEGIELRLDRIQHLDGKHSRADQPPLPHGFGFSSLWDPQRGVGLHRPNRAWLKADSRDRLFGKSSWLKERL